MGEYVPTTGHVQDAYCHVQQGVMGERGDAAHEKFHAEFDRWLAAHDAEVAARQIDAPSVREAIGEVLADMEATAEGTHIASSLALLQEITDAAIRAAVSPPSRTAKRTGYEKVIADVKVGGLGSAGNDPDVDAIERLDGVLLDHVMTAGLPVSPGDNRRKRALCTCGEKLVYGEGDYIAMSWHRDHLAETLLAAFPVLSRAAAAPAETEWEYGLLVEALGDTEPEPYPTRGSAQHVIDHPEMYRKWTHDNPVTMRRRRPAGPWLPVEGEWQ